ncbi:16S rRNA (guanine(966)-N(2))-methyltransferase RsmD [Spirulina sp. CS-785/01]|uniref:16S rRNA (guanine(966)-N(2))-methyltransferase RsmD n=1 Tax=Spirulina sp. CS-785/01 TaxID=3021716 RepID=UPI00232F0F8C|nr:16S rRNA (guanine(966)-N(2))-methyltransferase RsmD [Spirulina sp. CS-785/01]MDB9315332.1 16S rRNA (guanine(966)-N(2))-methyltransferase RsmD [Spirulina sp. CS-785/01]
MRIYGNRVLKTVPGRGVRPTPARVREALFNIWPGPITGCRWLDLCAGNGSMGAEALCRGASVVVGIEQNGQACGVIRQNWSAIAKSEQNFRLLRGDVRHRITQLAGDTFDFIYFDPPYASELYDPVITQVAKLGLLNPTAELAVEYDPNCWTPSAIVGLTDIRHKTYGNTALVFYTPDWD